MRKFFLIVSGLITLVAGLILLQKNWEFSRDEKDRLETRESTEGELKKINYFRSRLGSVKSLGELSSLKKEIESLSESERKNLEPWLNLRLAIVKFYEAEETLARAQQLYQATTTEMKKSDSDKIMNPFVMKNFEKAIEMYKSLKLDVDKLKEHPSNADYNYSFYTLKGITYYRSLQLLAKKEEAQEVFQQALNAYKNAIRIRPGDTDVEIDIEIMLKNQKGLSDGAEDQGNKKLKNLPAGIGKGSPKGKF